MSAHDHDELLDTSRLTPLARRLWEEARHSTDFPLTKLHGFIQVCILEASGPPAVAVERIRELDPDDLFGQYVRNIRAARARGEL